jgi:hypothetical protein
MTVPMENIVGASSSDQMVGGHRGLGMLSNVLNDPFRKLGRGGLSARQQAKMMRYQSQLSREELAHRANISHGELTEQTKEGGFIDEGMKRTEYGFDDQGKPYRGRPSSQSGAPAQAGGPGADTAEEQASMGVQTSYFPAGGASAKVRTSAGGGLELGAWQMPSRQFEGTPAEDTPAEDTPTEPFSGTRTLIPNIFDNRGATVQANNDDGGFEAIPGRSDRVKHNAEARNRVEQANAFNVAEAQKSHMERTGTPMPDDIALEVGSRQNVFNVPTAQSIEYDKQAAAGKPGFDRTADDEKGRILRGPKGKKPAAVGSPQPGGGVAGMGPAAPAAEGGGVGSALLEGGVKGVAAGVGGALGGPVGAALAGGVAQAGINAVKGKRPKRPVQGTPIKPATPA